MTVIDIDSMVNYMKNFCKISLIILINKYVIFVIASLAILSSCVKEAYEDEQEKTAICLTIGIPETRASIFDSPASLNNPDVGGGDFAVYAISYGKTSSTGNVFMNNVRVNYFPDADDWRFMDEKGQYVDFYWPLGNKTLDFFGHFPLNPDEAAVSNVSFTYEDGPSFEFSLPLYSYDPSADRNATLVNSKVSNQEGLREFVYSYVTAQSKETQVANPENPGIKMNFSHPFAAVCFHLGQSYRMALHDITLTNIKYEGIYRFDQSWSVDFAVDDQTGNPKVGDLWIEVEKDIPTPINFNSPIGGPYLVAPQSIPEDAKFVISYTRLDLTKETKTVTLKSLGGIEKWEAGKLYTYKFSLGNTEEEILFKVTTENWKVVDHKNKIDVE